MSMLSDLKDFSMSQLRGDIIRLLDGGVDPFEIEDDVRATIKIWVRENGK